MTNKQAFIASLFRFLRVMLAQAFAFWATETAGIEIPYVNLSVGALINMAAKFLRDKYNWDWLIL